MAMVDIMPCSAKPHTGILPQYNTQTQVLGNHLLIRN